MKFETGMTYPLGNSGLRITPIGLGCWQFSMGKGLIGNYWGIIDREEIRSIVRVTLEGGVNWFDTAEAYGFGQSEEALSQALSDLAVESGSALIATKWFPLLRPAGSITRSFHKRQEALGHYPVDLHQVHFPMSVSSIASQMNHMADLLDQRRIKAVGVSNFSADQMRRADDALSRRGHRIASNQVRYSLLDRAIEKNGVLDAAKERGITIIAYSPLAQGLLTGKFHDDPSLIRSRPGPRRFMPQFKEANLKRTAPLIDELRAVAGRYEATVAQAALSALVRNHGETVVAIPGASKTHHAQQNVRALAMEMSEVEISGIWDQAGALE